MTRKYDLYSADFKSDPHSVFDKMRADDPVLQQPGMDNETLIWFATRYHDVERILRDEPVFARDLRRHVHSFEPLNAQLDQMLNNHMLNKDGTDHRRLRTLVSKAFTPARVRALRPRIQAIANELIDAVQQRGEMDLMAEYAFHLPTIVILELLGIPVADRERFKAWSNTIIMPSMDPDGFERFVREMTAFMTYLRDLFAARRAQPTDDLTSALVHAEEQGDRLNENELYSMLMLLIVAGHETTVSLIGNAIVALWRHPDQLALLQAQPDLMPTAVEEFLRYDGSVERAFTRFVVEDVELGGETVPKGALIVPILAAANRDPAVFDGPDSLDVTRGHNPHLGFGKGAHYCVGAPLARLEAEIALNTLLHRLPGIRPAVALDTLRYRLTPTFRSLEALPVVW